MTSTQAADAAIDSAAARAFTDQYGSRATELPPVAIVIAAYNEEGAIGPVIEALPASVCGLATAKIVVSDGAVDGTVKDAAAAGALVCDVPVNRGQGAALRLGYRLAREGGAQYIVTSDADGQYNPAEIEAAARADPGRGSRLRHRVAQTRQRGEPGPGAQARRPSFRAHHQRADRAADQ